METPESAVPAGVPLSAGQAVPVSSPSGQDALADALSSGQASPAPVVPVTQSVSPAPGSAAATVAQQEAAQQLQATQGQAATQSPPPAEGGEAQKVDPAQQPAVFGQEGSKATGGSAGSAASGSGSSANNQRMPQYTENVRFVRAGKGVLSRVTQVITRTLVNLDVEGQPATNVRYGKEEGQWFFDGE